MTNVTTVVTCMTDAERPFLAEALRSVAFQSVPTAITLCVNRDNAWVDEVVARLGLEIDILRFQLAPPGIVRNRAVSRVQTEFVAFLDGDDVWHPEKLKQQLAVLDLGALDVVASKHTLIREDSKPFFFGFAREIPMTSSWLGRTAVFRAQPFDDAMVGEDVRLWTALQEVIRCGTVGKFLVMYRVREYSLSAETWSKRRKLAFARASHVPGVRYAMLAGSYAVHLALVGRGMLRG